MPELRNFPRLGFSTRLYRKKYVFIVNLAAKVRSILLNWLKTFIIRELATLKLHTIPEEMTYVL